MQIVVRGRIKTGELFTKIDINYFELFFLIGRNVSSGLPKENLKFANHFGIFNFSNSMNNLNKRFSF